MLFPIYKALFYSFVSLWVSPCKMNIISNCFYLRDTVTIFVKQLPSYSGPSLPPSVPFVFPPN